MTEAKSLYYNSSEDILSKLKKIKVDNYTLITLKKPLFIVIEQLETNYYLYYHTYIIKIKETKDGTYDYFIEELL